MLYPCELLEVTALSDRTLGCHYILNQYLWTLYIYRHKCAWRRITFHVEIPNLRNLFYTGCFFFHLTYKGVFYMAKKEVLISGRTMDVQHKLLNGYMSQKIEHNTLYITLDCISLVITLILLSYLAGIAIGIHFICLLTLTPLICIQTTMLQIDGTLWCIVYLQLLICI